MRSKLSLVVLFVGAIVFVASVFYLAAHLPERVASHFNASGQPNGWMPRGQHVLIITLVGLGIPLFIIGLLYSTRFLPPSFLNVPNAAYWRSPDHYPEACNMIFRWSFWFAALHLVWATILNYQLVEANRLPAPHLATMPTMILSGAHILGIAALAILLVLSFKNTTTG